MSKLIYSDPKRWCEETPLIERLKFLRKDATSGIGGQSSSRHNREQAEYLTLTEAISEIEQMRAAQCWVIAAIDTDKAAFGPFFEKNDAEYRMDSMPTEFAKKHKIRLCKGGE